MDSDDFSTDAVREILPPASSIAPTGEKSSSQDAGSSRRRRIPAEEPSDDGLLDEVHEVPHALDDVL